MDKNQDPGSEINIPIRNTEREDNKNFAICLSLWSVHSAYHIGQFAREILAGVTRNFNLTSGNNGQLLEGLARWSLLAVAS
jgi:hypothetical protein